MADVLRQGTVDAVLPVEPFITRMVQAGVGDLVTDYIRDVPPGLPVVVYVAQRDWANGHRTQVEAFRASLEEGHKFLLANSEQGMADVGKWLKLPPTVLAAQKLPVIHVDVPEAGLTEWGQILLGQGLIHNTPDVGKMLWK
jgi:NitT/TauT family transport system substrate-binding protein